MNTHSSQSPNPQAQTSATPSELQDSDIPSTGVFQKSIPNRSDEPEGAGSGSARGSTALPPSGFLTADFVKRRYKISNSTLYKWIAEGHLNPPVRISKRAVRWRAADLRAFEATFKSTGK